ncbi:MAG TPA: hypothetical protein VHW45_09890 [Candidatus Sulfotelmatobacter sp.]|jgi:hypothetical protein|nr:hypothetical protein [Candidatus Sulfotelmatobacter sp.]
MAKKFFDYSLPVRPNLDQLKHQAKDCCTPFAREILTRSQS